MATAKSAPKASLRRWPMAARPLRLEGRPRRIGLLGGSFNPAHEGHRALSLAVLHRLKLDEIWWLISPQNPLKPREGMANRRARLAGAKACARHPRIHVTDFEAEAGLVFTIDTLTLLARRYKDVRFVWIMGADNWRSFHHWRGWQRIMALFPIVIVGRPSYSLSAMAGRAAQTYRARRIMLPDAAILAKKLAPAWLFLPFHRSVSATQIRASTHSKKDIL